MLQSTVNRNHQHQSTVLSSKTTIELLLVDVLRTVFVRAMPQQALHRCPGGSKLSSLFLSQVLHVQVLVLYPVHLFGSENVAAYTNDAVNIAIYISTHLLDTTG